jgi:4-hydroxybenzoate polyprenyltransferase
MNTIHRLKIERLKFFLALSRTPHGLLDMATPAFAALLYLGGLPPARVILIGLLTAFAGYTAVYAANDIIDYRSDRRRLNRQDPEAAGYLDSILVRHPMAQGLLSYKEGISWALGWSIVALVGAWLLNPVCALIFLAGAALETLYCLLWQVSPLRAVVSGFVKNMGAIAALFAVDPNPAPGFTLILFLCLFFWEIGGQNIPHDWSDIEEDRRFQAKTIPVRLGEENSARLAFACVLAAALLCITLFFACFPASRMPAVIASLAVCTALLIVPGWKLFQRRQREAAMALFNRASYFPAAMLGAVLILISS